jgi:hypothetical protein
MRSSVRIATAAATVAGMLTCTLAKAGIVIPQVLVTSGTTVAGSSQLSPSNPGEVFGTIFSSTPSINNAGQVAFQAPVVFAGNTSSNNTGVFSSASGSVLLLAQTGYLAPSSAGGGTATNYAGTFSGFGTPIINAAGNTAMTGTLLSSGTNSAGGAITTANNSGIWSDRSGSLSFVDQIGTTSFGSPATTTKSIANMVQNPTGALAFTATTSDSPATGGEILDPSGSPGSPAFVARGSGTAPLAGATSTTFLNGGLTGAPAINSTGQIAFKASLTSGAYTGGTITSTNNVGIWKTVGGTPQLVAQAGTAAPGLGAGVNDNFGTTFSAPDFNNNGQTVFENTLVTGGTGNDITTTNTQTIYSDASGSLQLVARANSTLTPISGMTGVNFNNSFGNPVINDGGTVAFEDALNGTGITTANNAGIFSANGGIISLIAQKGQQAPGLPNGVTFASLNLGVAINALGDVIFSGSLANSPYSAYGTSFIAAQDPSGAVNVLAYSGESIQTAPGVFQNLLGFSLITASGGEDGRAVSWNDSNTFAVAATYGTSSSATTGSAIVELTAVVPEPTSMILLGTPLLLLRRRARRLRATQKIYN